MARRAFPLLGLAGLCAVATPDAARADFFDDARKTFTNDIPHFFQDDVPCTFGGRPTSGARTACKPERPDPRTTAPPRPARPADPQPRR